MTPAAPILVVKKWIAAPAEQLFAFWTEVSHLKAWWGPQGCTCFAAEIDLRVNGTYRLGNRLPDGTDIWITGRFELIETPRKLVYSWQCAGEPGEEERVTVRFEPKDKGTEVIVTHERIPSERVRREHEQGWLGCLEGLERHTLKLSGGVRAPL